MIFFAFPDKFSSAIMGTYDLRPIKAYVSMLALFCIKMETGWVTCLVDLYTKIETQSTTFAKMQKQVSNLEEFA